MTQFGEAAWRLLPAVRRQERRRFAFFAALFALIGLAQTVGLVGSEALLLSRLGVDALPPSYLLAAASTVAGSLLYGAVVGRARNDAVFVGVLVLGAAAALAGASGARAGLRWPLPALFALWYVAQTVYLNHFWTFSGDFFDTLASKRLFPLFTVGSSAGGLVGGVFALGLERLAPAEALIAAWALLLAAAAILVRSARGLLRRWGPLGLEESHETSVASLQAAVRHLGASPLGRWLVVSALGMVLALFVMQYVYSGIFLRAFPTTQALATFFAIYLAASNALEIVLELIVTPALIRRLGVGSANLVHPLLTLASFGALALQPGLQTAVAARMNRELFESAASGAIRNLIHNGLPARFRGRLRAFLEGIVVYAGMFAAGAVLLVAGDIPLPWLCAAGGGMALIYLLANLRVRSEYMHSLVQGLREGQLELLDLGDEIGRFEAARLATLWDALLPESGHASADAVLRLAPVLAARRIAAPLLRGAEHADARVRRASVAALGEVPGAAAARALSRALEDVDPEVRGTAVRALAGRGAAAAPALRARLDDPDPRVRAAAAAHVPGEGEALLARMLEAAAPGERLAALECIRPPLLSAALARTEDSDAGVRAAALECVVRLARPTELALAALRRHAADPDPRVRRAAITVLATPGEPAWLALLAEALSDPDRGVRRRAAELLGALGAEGVAAAAARLGSEPERSVGEVLLAIASWGGRRAHETLDTELRRCVESAWRHLTFLAGLAADGSAALAFLRAALEDAAAREQRLALRILSVREGTQTLRSVERALRLAQSRSRADALEVISNLGDRETAWRLVLMLEEGPLEEKLSVGGVGSPAAISPVDVLREADAARDRWVRQAALVCERAERGEPSALEEDMERILMLKRVPLFARLTLDQLEAVARIATETEYAAGEVILREGAPGGDLYVLAEGEADVVKGHGTAHARSLRSLRAPDYFGEMAVLDDAPRSASIVVRKDARLLVLRGERLKELMLDVPEIAFEICRVLTARLRAAEESLGRAAAPEPGDRVRPREIDPPADTRKG